MNKHSVPYLTQILGSRQSIFVRLFTSFVSFSLVIIILTGSIYYEYARQTTIKKVNEQVQNLLIESVALFETGFQFPIQSHLELLESTPSMDNFLTLQKDLAALVRFDIEKQFSQMIRSRPELYRSIRYVDAFGYEQIHIKEGKRQRTLHSLFTSEGKHPRQTELKTLFEALKQGVPRQIIFSKPFSTAEGKFLFYAGISKMEPEIGGIGGTIIIECDLSSYIQSLNKIRIYGYSIAWLLSPQGHVLATPEEHIAHSPVHQKIINNLLQEDNNVTRYPLFPGSTKADEPFLTIILSVPELIFQKQIQIILKSILLIVLLTILFAFLVAWLVSRRITQPITELVHLSHQLASGDYTTRSNLKDNSEIGELSQSFNNMAETLEQSIKSLDQQLTRRISVEQDLQQSHESLQLILNSTSEGIFGIDTEGQCTFCNPSTLKILGYKQQQNVVGQNFHTLLQPYSEDGQEYPQNNSLIIQAMQCNQIVHSDTEVFWRADKTSIAVEYKANPVMQNEKMVGAVVSFSDISARKQKDKKIVYQAHYDMLTGLPNRFLAMDRLEQMLNNAERHKQMAAVLFIDLDGFKKVNDMLGHEMGDKILVESALRLKGCLRTQDNTGRLGGDEFIVLLPDLKQQLDVRFAVEKILEVFRTPFNIEGHELVLTASIGIATYPNDSKLGVELLRNADIAMYESKQSGRNTYHFFSEELNTGIQRRLEVEEQLHNALARQEFYLVYQPIIDLQSMDIAGAEVLLRWNNSKLGMVTPDEFIPITEQIGCISEIGHYILHEAISQTAQWQKIYQKEFKISVNVSPRQLHDQDFFESLITRLECCELEGHSLQLELTEGVLMSQNESITQTIALMRDSEINIAMDDFGTGYSSLSYLRNYPFDSLKIDRTFVRDIHQDSNDQALVLATLNMSKALGIQVVAEGIETEAQLQFLKQAGCDYGQGYFFSKPISSNEFEIQYLQKNQINKK